MVLSGTLYRVELFVIVLAHDLASASRVYRLGVVRLREGQKLIGVIGKRLMMSDTSLRSLPKLARRSQVITTSAHEPEPTYFQLRRIR